MSEDGIITQEANTVQKVRIIKVPNPFQRSERIESTARYDHPIRISELVRDHGEGIRFGVTVNGQVVDEADWDMTILRQGDELMLIPCIEGGNNSGKGIFNALAMIAITVGAYVALGPGGLLTTPLTGGWLVGGVAVVSLSGGLLLNALTPVPSVSKSGGDSSELSQAYGWNPQTQQQVGLSIPHFYGKNKLYGNVISAFTEPTYDNNKQVLNAIIALGRGPFKSISDIKINGQDVASIGDDLTIETRLGMLDQSAVLGNDKTKTEYTPNLQVSTKDGPVIYEVPS